MELGGVGIRSEDREMLQQDLESMQTLRGQRKAVKFKLGKGQPNIPGENNHRHAMKEGLRKDLSPPPVPWGWFPSHPPATSPLLCAPGDCCYLGIAGPRASGVHGCQSKSAPTYSSPSTKHFIAPRGTAVLNEMEFTVLFHWVLLRKEKKTPSHC